MSTTVRTILIFFAAAIAATAAAPPVDMPGWAAGLIAALAAGFAGIGLLPPNWHLVGDGQRAIKKKNIPKPPTGAHKTRVDDTGVRGKPATISGQSELPPRASHRGGRHTSFAIVIAALLMFLAPAFIPTSASAAINVQAEFNKAQHDLAAQGWNWIDGGGPHPLVSKAKTGGWIADGDYIHRCSVTCAINSQICWFHGWLSPSGYWIELTKTRCR